MTSWTWDRITKAYEKFLVPPPGYERDPYLEAFGKGMLEIIGRLRVDPEFEQASIGTADNLLTLRLPNTRRNILLLWTEPNDYEIGLDFAGDTADTFWGDWTKVDSASAMNVLHEYYARLKRELGK